MEHFTADQIANACADADLTDAQCESLLIALHYTAQRAASQDTVPTTVANQAINDALRLVSKDSERDAARMDWLVQHIVEVRDELRYGTKFMFISQAKYDEDEFIGTTLREQIDAAMAVRQSEKGGA